jgi:hypothetical protein
MRYFTLILSIWFLGLSVMPCTDVHADHPTDQTSFNSHVSCNHDSPTSTEKQDVDTCNPFCVCQCCSIKTEQPATLYQFIPVSYQLHLPPLSALPLGLIYLETLLQPPRLG